MATTTTPPPSPPRARRRWRRWLAAGLGLLLLGLAGGGLYLRHRLYASLPPLDGTIAAPGLTAPVRLDRDALGVPTITAANRADLAYGLGFAHGQDRFFQMDLLRRASAGELAALLGSAVVWLDRDHRVHRFRARCEKALAALDSVHRAQLDAYVAGVNAGLGSLAAPPPEYVLLGTAPEAWRPEDSLLVVCTMYLFLQGADFPREAARGVMRDTLPAPLLAFLNAPGSEWDAPLQGPAFAVPPIPGPEVYDLRNQPPPPRDATYLDDLDRFVPGSNNWVVAGAHTAHGGAIVANDMHLDHGLPSLWYRACLCWPGGRAGKPRRAVGVTLPGGPVLVAGSNGRVAWSFTNTEGDWADWIPLDAPAQGGPFAYRTPDGVRALVEHREVIRVRGAPDQDRPVLESIWGPVIGHDHQQRMRSLRWVAHDPEGVNLHLGDLMDADTLEEALAVAAHCGTPHQNCALADDRGRIAWTILGRIPRRVGWDGQYPGSWADGRRRWDGYLAAEEYPRVVDPAAGRLWTANNRVAGGADLAKVGRAGYDRGARAGRIRDRLFSLGKATEADMLAIQLDDRNVLLDRWQRLLLEVLSPEAVAGQPRLADLRRAAAAWGGHAAAESVGYRVLFEFRRRTVRAVLGPLTYPCRKADAAFRLGDLPQQEGPVWKLVAERPAHLLPPPYATWEALLVDVAGETERALTRDGRPLAAHPWGEANTLALRHPLSGGLPAALGGFLNLPPAALPGGWMDTPRVQTPRSGASERFAVSPGKEALAYFHMPGGQSGHPFSPHYGDGQAAWAEGRPTPLLPGPAVHTLQLVP